MDLKQRTVKGISWSFISQVARFLLRLAIVAVLARLLTPEDFGLVAMVTVFTNFFLLVNDFGIPAAIIQKKDVDEGHLSSGFWVNLAEGFILSLLFLALAPLIAWFYNEKDLISIIIVLSPIFLIASFGMIQMGIFSKRLDFRRLAFLEITAVAVSGSVAVALAYADYGVWSLVIQIFLFSFILALLLWLTCEWKPKFIFNWDKAKELLSFGLNLTGFNIVNYFNRNLDNLLIGRFLGAESLGFYDLAYKIFLFPISNISYVIGRVMFPALSEIQEDKERVRINYIKACRYISSVSFPVMIGIMVTAPLLVRVVFGPQWEESIFIVQVLAIVGLLQSLTTTMGWLYQSQGRTDVLFRWGILAIVVYGIAFAIGLHWGINGVAVAYVIAGVLLVYPNFAIPFRFIDLGVFYFLKRFTSVAAATAVMGLVMYGSRLAIEKYLETPDVITLIITIAIGVVCYAGSLHLMDRKLFSELYELVRLLVRR